MTNVEQRVADMAYLFQSQKNADPARRILQTIYGRRNNSSTTQLQHFLRFARPSHPGGDLRSLKAQTSQPSAQRQVQKSHSEQFLQRFCPNPSATTRSSCGFKSRYRADPNVSEILLMKRVNVMLAKAKSETGKLLTIRKSMSSTSRDLTLRASEGQRLVGSISLAALKRKSCVTIFSHNKSLVASQSEGLFERFKRVAPVAALRMGKGRMLAELVREAEQSVRPESVKRGRVATRRDRSKAGRSVDEALSIGKNCRMGLCSRTSIVAFNKVVNTGPVYAFRHLLKPRAESHSCRRSLPAKL